ncbi:hypothetical protein OROMI_000928 [Orobanche minor]
MFMEKLLVLTKQDPSVSSEAQEYALWIIPALFGAAISKPFVRYLQAQSLTFPILLSSIIVLCCHVPMSWTFMYKLHLGSNGAAIAICVSNWLYVVMLVLYIKLSPSCTNSRLKFSIDAFYGMGLYFRLAIPSAVMVCLTISTLHFTLPYGLGAAASTRISNELGAGKPEKARMVVWTIMFFVVVETITISIALFSCRHILGRAFSSEEQVVDYVAAMSLLICVSTITDSLQAAISGTARGSGWQHICAYVNLGAFYFVGIPVAVVLGFVEHLKAKGFWIGIVIGSAVQSALFSIVTGFTNWEKQATKAMVRVNEG